MERWLNHFEALKQGMQTSQPIKGQELHAAKRSQTHWHTQTPHKPPRICVTTQENKETNTNSKQTLEQHWARKSVNMSGLSISEAAIWFSFCSASTCIYVVFEGAFLLTTSILHIRCGDEGTTAWLLGCLQKRDPQHCMAFPEVHDKESPSPFWYYLRAPRTPPLGTPTPTTTDTTTTLASGPRIRLETDALL